MNIVLFLGAGYSAAYNLPIMNNFLTFTDSSIKLDQKEKEFINNLALEARKANSFLESSATNLEDILSFSIMADRLSSNENAVNSNNNKLRIILQKIFTQTQDLKNFYNNFNKLRPFLAFNPKEKNHSLSIITTNYDICIECSLFNIGLKTNPCFTVWELDNKEKHSIHSNLYANDGIPVMKLHGSVNWFEENIPSSGFLGLGNNINQVDYEDGNQYIIPSIYSSIYDFIRPPVIIPPSFLKPELKGPLNIIWKAAAEKLKHANLIVFVGYSFPMTDTEMMYFFASSLTDNSIIRSIVLIDPNAKEIADKIYSANSKFGSHFKSLLKINNNKWETTDLKQYIS